MKRIIIVLILSLVFGLQIKGITDEHKHQDVKTDKMVHPTLNSTKKISKIKYVVCPVTKTKINPAKAYSKTVYKGRTYYFCCAGCPEEFKKNPEKYTK